MDLHINICFFHPTSCSSILDWAVRQSDLDAQVLVENVALSSHEYRVAPEGMPPVSWFNCSSETPWKRVMSDLALFPDVPLDDDVEKKIRRGYYAAVTLLDSQLGRLLDALSEHGLEKDTAIIFHSDHGFHLGYGGRWCKQSNAEVGVRVPLLLSVPWWMQQDGTAAVDKANRQLKGKMVQLDAQAGAASASERQAELEDGVGMETAGGGRPGTRSKALVELVDMYPTVLEIAGLAPNPVL